MNARSAAVSVARMRICAVIALGVAMASGAWGQVPGSAAGEFIYRTQPRDTLIGLGKRLLTQPPLWRSLQQLNHIGDPRRIPAGTPLRIPYEWLRLRPETASVAGVSGTVTLSGTAIAAGQTLSPGSVVETGPDGSVTLSLADGSVLTLQKSSALSLDEMSRVEGVDGAHSMRLKLGAGRVETVVKPHRDVGRFEIATPVAVSAVRGTRFRNGFSPDTARATTETLEGAVAVASPIAAVRVDAGYGTRIERDRAPLPPVNLLPAPDLSGVPAVVTAAEWVLAWAPVAGASAYRAQLSTQPGFQTLRADVQTTLPTAQMSFLPDGDYWLRVRSIDGLGLEGADASVQIRRHRLPEPPVAVAPLDGARRASAMPRFAWAERGPDLRYDLQVAAGADFSTLVCVRAAVGGAGVDCDPLPAGRYFWRIASVAANGERGPWSAVHDFKQLSPGPVPDEPRRVGRGLQLTWPAGPADHLFHAEISRDADFRHALLSASTPAPRWSVAQLSAGVYFVRVQALDADGDAGPFGPPRRFAVPVPLWVKIGVPLAVLLIPWL